MKSVSYTHLDVYKRQGIHIVDVTCEKMCFRLILNYFSLFARTYFLCCDYYLLCRHSLFVCNNLLFWLLISGRIELFNLCIFIRLFNLCDLGLCVYVCVCCLLYTSRQTIYQVSTFFFTFP